MVKFVVILMLIAFYFAGTASAQSSGLGLGVIFSEQTGISFKQWVGGKTAVAGGAAWSFGDRDELNLHIDYLFHNFNIVHVQKGRLPIYYGVGGRIKFRDEGGKGTGNTIGVRIPIGVNYIFSTPSFDAFFEIVPLLNLAPDTEFDFKVAFGGRYFF